MQIERAEGRNLAKVIALLRRGGMIIYPTETVYGLGCLASIPEFIERIAEIKESRPDAPFLILIRDVEEMQHYAQRIPPAAQRLAKAFWPGPLTMILPAKEGLHPRLIGPSGGVGMRVSSHPWCRALLEQLDDALISTSANFTGSPSPCSLVELDDHIANQVDLVVDEGTLPGKESTVVDLCVDPAAVRREGTIAAAELKNILGTLGI